MFIVNKYSVCNISDGTLATYLCFYRFNNIFYRILLRCVLCSTFIVNKYRVYATRSILLQRTYVFIDLLIFLIKYCYVV